MIEMISIYKLHEHPDNIRKTYGDLKELEDSIKANGILQNLTVVKRELGDGYNVVIGNRRLKAARGAGLKELPCSVADLTKQEQAALMLTENLQRNSLSPVEQAQGMQLMLDLGDDVKGIAAKTGLSQTTVRHRLEIGKLDKELVEKTSSEYAFTLSDYAELEAVKNVEKRNSILKAATSRQSLQFQIQQSIKDDIRQGNLKVILEAIKAAGLEEITDAKRLSYVSYISVTDKESISEFDSKKINGRAEFFKNCSYGIDLYAAKRPEEKSEKSAEDKAAEEEQRRIKKLRKAAGNKAKDFICGIIAGEIETPKNWDAFVDDVFHISIGFIDSVSISLNNATDMLSEYGTKDTGSAAESLMLDEVFLLNAVHKAADCIDYPYCGENNTAAVELLTELEKYGVTLTDDERAALDSMVKKG